MHGGHWSGRLLSSGKEKEELMRFWTGHLPDPDIRSIEDLQSVLADRKCRATGPLYFMYRDLALTSRHRQWLSENSLRYDITVINPRDLCGEKAKTKGHYHPSNPSGTGYPEIYEVIEGCAHYLLQRRDLSDVVLIRAVVSDLVIVPPFYGHVTINAGSTDLVMANMVSSVFTSEYADYELLRGAAYYELSDGTMIKNPAYEKIPRLRKTDAISLRNKVPLPAGSLYEMIGNGILEFLNRPEEYPSIFKGFP
jgi:glucose-6-phosphate isomerase